MTPTEQSDPRMQQMPDTQPMFARVLRASPELVRDTLQDIRSRFREDVDEDALGRLELVLAEVMNNVAEHAPSVVIGRLPVIHLCVVRHVGGLACALTDDGSSLPAECLAPRNLPLATDMPEGGFGWYLIQDLTQALCYYREGGRNYLAFSVPFATRMDGRPLS
ncbi:ATP-binding protein [Paracoccus sp. 1_MG-2023]|uniref:ATP-binding protein n=1 Tax=unclassified Paracoccus (in: a-proteobacteria) TaxID=2688777 RepID=UPI001C09B42E|nr:MULTISPECIES: ATP-binding protein [unclassified Paracoccus (in: a-proteobacteria)]MBU2957327.1 ATP-binding protein [Paracoccus sp. C2R09]MDO6669905.1 ATP-binding protein [Paracoccus sp. 1_MG-2023]